MKWSWNHGFVTSSHVHTQQTPSHHRDAKERFVYTRSHLVSSFRVSKRCLSALRRRLYTILMPVSNRYRHDSITHANRAAATPIDSAQFWACHKFRSSILFEIPDAAQPTGSSFQTRYAEIAAHDPQNFDDF